MSDSSRLDTLELAVARLTREVVALREEVRRRGAGEGSAEREERESARRESLRSELSSERATEEVTDRVSVALEAGQLPERVTAAAGADAGVAAMGDVAAEPSRPGDGGERNEPFVSDELRRMASAMSPPPAGAPRRQFGTAGRSASAAASAAAPSRFQRQNLEALIGRYGTLALAAFTILMGVGVFIGWAIKNGVIGPELRVALGAVLAAVMAAVGVRLRRGDSPRFGSVLLALALAIMHVVCWGAGPLLQLVPNVLALGVATAASAALAWLALREEDQTLFNVGFGGALLAPFVTSSETGDAVILLLYGAVVLGAGMRVLRDRAWGKVPFVLGIGIMAYTAAASGQLAQSDVWVRAGAPAIFALAMAWLSLILVPGKSRERLAVTALLSAIGALYAMHHRDPVDAIRFAIAGVATVTGFLVGTGGVSERLVRYATALLIPLAAFLGALICISDITSPGGVMVALAWAVGSTAAAWANRDGAREWHAFSATVFGGIAAILQFERGVEMAIALAVYGAIASLVMRRFELRGVGIATFGWLLAAAAVAFVKLDGRSQWLTNPFLTPASGAAAAVCAAWLVFSWNAARMGAIDGGVVTTLPRTMIRIFGGVITFLWIHVELAHTVSLDVSTFLLVTYYAVTGILSIGVGRWRSIPLLRQLGLALSVFAAIKAMVETSSLSIGWRVGGYLLAGIFLLGVAYWYRGTGGARSAAESAEPAEGGAA